MSAPDLKTIQTRMESDVNHYIPGAELRPRFSVLGVLTKVFAAAIHALYQFAENLLRNILPSTCHDDWLPAWAYVLKKPRKTATAASGTVTFTNPNATPIPAGTLLQSPSGLRYATISEGTITVTVTALEPGYTSNTTEPLTLSTPISGVASAVTTSGISGGADLESLADWRTRLVEAFANRAKIGDADDYAEWAIDSHPAIKYAWVYGNTPSLGDITIIVATGDADPVPDTQTLAAVRTALDRKRNVGCTIHLLAPEALPVAVTIAHVPSDSREAVLQALISHISSLRGRAETLYVADIHAAIRTVYAGIYSLTAPTADATAGNTQLIILGGVTWA
jgi:uncharacterized phage protein gp47/JayE